MRAPPVRRMRLTAPGHIWPGELPLGGHAVGGPVGLGRRDHEQGVHHLGIELGPRVSLQPAQGFAFQRVYTDDRSLDESLAVEDHDVVLVPRGYHPVVVPFGYESYYLNVMAGPKREWHFKNDPAHEWMLQR